MTMYELVIPTCSTKRARMLVATSNWSPTISQAIKNTDSVWDQLSNNPFEESPVPICSPPPLWWNELFEGTDNQLQCNVDKKLILAVKRKLDFTSKFGGDEFPDSWGKHGTVIPSFPEIDTTAGCSPQEVFAKDVKALVQVASELSKEVNTHDMISIVSPGCHISIPNILNDFGCAEKPGRTNSDQLKVKKSYPSRTKINEAKLALNSGEEHKTPSGIIRRARSLRAPCQETCKRCASPRLTHENRLAIFKEFWALKVKEEQWKFISPLITCSTPKKKVFLKGSKRGKCSSRVYCFKINGTDQRVCKTMFISTLSICDSWIDSSLSHVKEDSVIPDQRGRGKENL